MKNNLTTLLAIGILSAPTTAFAVAPNQMEIKYSVTNKSTVMTGLYGSNFTKDKVKASLQKKCKRRKVLTDFKVGKKTSEGTPFSAACVKKK